MVNTRAALIEHVPPLHRPARGLMYLCIALAGLACLFIPLAFLANIVNFTIGAIGGFLILGGLVSGVGHLYRIVVMEVAGYPLILTAMLALTVVLFLEADENPARLFVGLVTLSFTLGLYGRVRDLTTLLQYRAEAQKMRELHDTQ